MDFGGNLPRFASQCRRKPKTFRADISGSQTQLKLKQISVRLFEKKLTFCKFVRIQPGLTRLFANDHEPGGELARTVVEMSGHNQARDM